MLKEGHLAIRNFRQFDRNRDGIRLPYQLLDDCRFRALPDAHKAHLVSLLLLAGRMENILPISSLKLRRMFGATEAVDLDALAEFILIFPAGCLSDRQRTKTCPVSEKVRAAVIVRDGARCRRCRSTRHLEVDHIVPASRGGTSDQDNLQTLCRRCNRRKRNKVIPRF
jgi:5-methylcytosine-specific restriction protein A